MESWQKLLAAAAGATGVAALLWYLLKEDAEADAEAEAAVAKAGAAQMASKGANSEGGLGKEDLLQILKEMVDSQKGTTARLKGVAKELSAMEDPDFDVVYALCKAADPVDPLEARGLTMNDLEAPLQRNQNDQMVMMAMQALMSGGQDDMMMMAAPSVDISVEKLIEINTFLVSEVQNFMKKHAALPDKKKYDIKSVMLMVQATLDSKVIKKFGYESTDVQGATMQNQEKLGKNQAFLESHATIQQSMEMFMRTLQQ